MPATKEMAGGPVDPQTGGKVKEVPDVQGKQPSAVVAVAASAGGVDALQHLAAGLPAGIDAAFLVVLHIPPTGPSVLPGILSRAGPLPARHAVDMEPLAAGVILVAPPDRHLTAEDGQVRVCQGPRENLHRPSADVMFRSVADSYGTRAAGIVLSGTMDDGAAGLRAIEAAGGFVMVQEPSEAAFPGMPAAALEAVHSGAVCSTEEMGARLARWRTGLEADPGRREGVGHPSGAPTLSPFTCPECGGTLWSTDEHGTDRYRCRVGHGFSEDALLRGKQDALEAALWAAVVALEEKADLCRRISKRLGAAGRAQRVEACEQQIVAAEDQIALLRATIDDIIIAFPAALAEDAPDD
ncbi:MAG TPA: chemotaxis protein CheB [Acidimicrobiales bacterium]|nr:chemotaxis protein CheB [Acidimicrobiales bacterium]